MAIVAGVQPIRFWAFAIARGIHEGILPADTALCRFSPAFCSISWTWPTALRFRPGEGHFGIHKMEAPVDLRQLDQR